jgi:hypothetical protein
MPLSDLKNKASKKAQQRTDAAPPADDSTQQLPLFKVLSDGQGNFKDVRIQQTGFLELLRNLGFRRYDINESFIIVRIQDNIIEQIPIHRLRELVVRHFWDMDPDALNDLHGCPKDALLEKLHRSLGSLLTDDKLSLLVDMQNDGATIELVQDTIDQAFYFYQNGFIEVNKKGYELKPYTDLPGYIWRDQIIPRQFKKLTLKEIETGVYWKFANNVAGNADGKNPARFSSFLTITGYNLHRFFETKLRCTIFLDARMSDDPDGRSGKSLHCKAMRQIMNADPVNGKQFITIDGKTFDTGNRFCLDQLDISTRVVVFDDIKRGFVIEDFFNSIVDGLIRERKGDVFKARIQAKIIFTLNYTISIRGGSARDRVIEFEFADYYSASHTPEMEFNQWFFRDWSADEYQRFDNFMMTCVMEYLKCGIIMPDTVNLEARKLRDETAQEFIDWMEALDIEHESEFEKKELYRRWMDFDDDNKPRNIDFKWMKPRVLTKWLTLYATYRPEFAGYRSRRSSGKDLIQFFHNRAVSADILSDTNFPPVFFEGKSDRVKGDKLPF